ncbi:MAG: hypothetical protein ACRBBK_10950 [Paracoccaceae bacterium]
MLSTESLSNTRTTVFALTGGICLFYAIMALASGRPDPISFWIPGIAGLVAAGVLFVSSRIAGRKNALMAFDEGYARDARRAASASYWVALFLYPAFGLLLALRMIEPELTLAVMGTLTGASYLLLQVWFDLRGRA